MKANFKKIDKDFVITDESINLYGFKLLTSGYLIEEFLKVPNGYYDHDEKDGVLVRWEDVRKDGTRVLGKPVINLDHPRGERTVKEIESGFIKSASVGKLVVIEATEEPHPTKAGETVPVMTKWYNRECSLVGLPGNRNATVQLYDEHENEIQLSDIIKTDIKMSNPKIPTELLQALNLNDEASSSAAVKAIKDLADKAARTDAAEKELSDLKAKQGKDKVKDLLDAAQEEGKAKITKEQAELFSKKYADDPDGLKDLLDTMPVIGSVVDKLKVQEDKGSQEYKDLSDKSIDELMRSDLADTCRKKYPQLFKDKWVKAYGEDSWNSSVYAKENG